MNQDKPSTGELLNMKLDQLLGRWPNTARVLIANRMACIGCDFARFHSTHQALEAYGLQRDPFLNDLVNALM